MIPASKRRRINDSNSALHKPFKSPFKTPIKPDPATSKAGQEPQSTISTAAPSAHSLPSVHKIPPRISTPSKPTDAETRQYRSITAETAQLRTAINTLKQATSLLESPKDEQLKDLIEKWRVASRAAAEELFATSRDRVNRMGGVGAWREREREKREWQRKWDEEGIKEDSRGKNGKYDGNDEKEEEEEEEEQGEGSEETKNERKARTQENTYEDDEWQGSSYEKEILEAAREKEQELLEGDDDDSFTMGMMLKTLNVDFKAIGYCEKLQQWED